MGVIRGPLAYKRDRQQPQVDMGPIVENKRLSHVLQTARVMQVQRDDLQASNMAHRTNLGWSPYAKMPWPEPNAGARDSRAQAQAQAPAPAPAQTKAALRTAGAMRWLVPPLVLIRPWVLRETSNV
ncbi:hypothetical protein [Variovorax sp. MHTC-1]|uniref:hypothetical protein n=1 Tax=Variovorax sp. MHTC-1 TaxID=2495593 RepID=UPI000F85CAED|nr:hypothetical protein [Variovorax sp. MHTC-1]RST50117.1 hypothetical protein EJI01_22125 [Variovorax sp. MHTC-1]